MDNVVDIRVLAEDLVQGLLIVDVNIVKLRLLAADELDAVDNFLRGIAQIVNDDNFVVGLEQRKRREGANVASATVRCQSRCPVGFGGAPRYLPCDENGADNHLQNRYNWR